VGARLESLRGFGEFIEELAGKGEFSGVVTVAEDGQVVFEHTYGLADRSSRAPNRPDTKFIVASVTQTFTAVATLQLVSQGKISLNASLSEYLPDYPNEAARRATVRQLLAHTAGVGSVVTAEAFRRAPRNFRNLSDYVRLVASEPLTNEPGARFRYTDGDCVLLGAIIERTSGVSYYDYVRDHVFRPANMNDTGFDLVPRPRELARGYTVRELGGPVVGGSNGHPRDNAAILPTKASPGVAAYSTGPDLLRFGTALLGRRLLNAQASDDLFEGRVLTGDEGPREHYGFGFFDGNFANVRIVNHGGTGPGVDVGFDLYPELGFVVVVMSNDDPPTAQRVRDELRRNLSASRSAAGS